MSVNPLRLTFWTLWAYKHFLFFLNLLYLLLSHVCMIYMWVQVCMCHCIYVEFRGQLLGLGSLFPSWIPAGIKLTLLDLQSLLAEPSCRFFLLLLFFFLNYICIWKWIYKVTSFHMGFSYLLHFSWYPLSSFLPSLPFSHTSFDSYYSLFQFVLLSFSPPS